MLTYIVTVAVFLTAVTADGEVHEQRFKNMTVLYNGSLELEDNNLEQWLDEDFVEVYLAEYHLQHMALSSWIGFSTSHMAVMFQNPRNRKWFVMDSYAKNAETIANLVMPSIAPNSPLNSMSLWERLVLYFKGGYVDYLTWDNAGYVRTHEDKSQEFQDLRHIGTVRGKDIKDLREWVINDYAKQNETHPFTFDMWQIYNASNNERIRKSRMCHDFVEEILGRIKFVKNEDPVYGVYDDDSVGTISVYRDGLNLNVTDWKEVDMKKPKFKRDFQRFLRFFRNHIYEATRDMSFSRITTTKMIMLGMPIMAFLDGYRFVRVELSKYGSFNYCRMPMDFEKGKAYVPAKLNDTRQQCFLPHYNYYDFHDSIRFTFADYMIAIEQKLDDIIFGVDGEGGDILSHFTLILESSIILVALTKLVRWTASKIMNRKRVLEGPSIAFK